MSEPSSTSSTPFTVFDYLGLAFLLVPPGVIVEALMKGETLTLIMFIYAAPAVLIGAVCIYIGRNWDRLKITTKSSIVTAVDYLSTSYVVLFSIFVLFLIGIAISPMLLWPPAKNMSSAAPLAAAMRAPPVVLSDEEKQFRFGLRTFVLSNLQEQVGAFTQLASRLTNTDSNTVFVKDRETTISAGILLDSLLRITYYLSFDSLRKQADTTITAMDPSAVMASALAYFKAYNEAQNYFRNFLILAGLDPTQIGMLSHWIDVDARATQAFNDLVTSPLSGKFANSGFIPGSNRFSIYLTSETRGK